MLKKFLIISTAVLGTGFLAVLPVNATPSVDPLVVQFEKTPLFNEVNFLPGESIGRWVKVTNNSGETQRIAVEAINESDPDNLGNALTLEIKEGGSRLYDGTLSQFFNAGEVYLSDLAGSGSQTQYDFIVTFYSGGNNAFQEKTLGFDILIGFQGTEGGLAPGGGSGGGGLPPGLTILDESVRLTDISETSVIISWTTSYLSTSQVIYGKEGESHTLDLTDISGTPPKYGYAQTTLEYDTSTKVTSHSITITGLTPETKYYYRAVSHGSFAVSREYSFTTLEEKEQKIEITEEKPIEEGETPEISGEITEGKNKISGGALPPAASPETGEGTETEGAASNQLSKEEPPESKGGLASFLASIGTFLKKISSSTLLIIILILILIILAFVLVKKIGKNLEEKKKNKGYK